ncbi:acetaldehyde dehydrogenase (acetylating) [Actinoplanes sp. NPDC051851]|uniref:acetylating acetaldehyde dehydrogenase n=1 Tax=Actinoplanes sp. NPDC051851 TaxID=3154753 RepID=UPI00343BF0C3
MQATTTPTTGVRRSRPLRAAVIGAGLIGLDLAMKIQRSAELDCRLVTARDEDAPGLRAARDLGCRVSADGVDAVLATADPYDIVFDASNATAHPAHWQALEPLGCLVVDLTPSGVGHAVVPAVNGDTLPVHRNLNLVSCGGQACVPILHALSSRYRPSYVEVVTTAANLSVGRATRLNLDEYLATTRDAVRASTGTSAVKTILNLSPARPPATFRVAMSFQSEDMDQRVVGDLVHDAADRVRAFVPGFRVRACTVTDGVAFVAVEVEASGDRIPSYAGNLDIINSAAVLVAEQYARQQASLPGTEVTRR